MERYDFRGKTLDNEEWVYGSLCRTFESALVSNGYAIQVHDLFEMEAYPVDPQTIGQCTGIKDKNGNLIYEGDICRTPNGTLMTVIFDGDRFVFKNENNSFGLSYYANSVEIISNIHTQ